MNSNYLRPNRRAVLTGAAALGGLSLLPRRARAADQWPTRPVKLVVPFAAGGTTDILARVVAAKVSEEFGQQFIVENKTGAGGNIAADFVAKAEPDGYTFVVGTPGTHAINQFVFKNMTYDQVKDIAPVIIIARVPNLFSVTNSLPVKSVAEFIAYAKAKPGELFYGTPGLGSTAHVSTELFKSMTGVEMTHVPYKGSAPALTDLIAGRVQLMIDNLPAAQPFAEASSIRPIAVSSAKRWPGFPDLPTIAEAGVPGYEASSWFTHRRAGEDAEGDHRQAQRQRRQVPQDRGRHCAAAQARRRAGGRIAGGHAGLRAGGDREVGQGRAVRRHQAGVARSNSRNASPRAINRLALE